MTTTLNSWKAQNQKQNKSPKAPKKIKRAKIKTKALIKKLTTHN